jgi:hypothetical protein
MTDEGKPQNESRNPTVNTGSMVGALWSIGWMFTIGYANLIWWKALLALVIWPYYLGLVLR